MDLGEFITEHSLLIVCGALLFILLAICTGAILASRGFFSNIDVTLPSSQPTPVPAPSSLSGTFLGDTIPANMAPGKTYEITLIARNTGGTQWSQQEGIQLEPVDGYDTRLFNNTTITMEPGIITKYGANYTWKISIAAPKWVDNYTLAYRMKNNTGYYFSEPYAKTVAVGDPNDSAVFVSQSIKYYPPIGTSLSMRAGARQNVSIAVKNMGRYNWSQADKVRLAAIDYEPNDATKFYPGYLFHIAPESVVRPGEPCAWNLNITAPSYPGTYHMKYRMQKDGQWFGSTLNVTVSVL